MSTTTLSPTAVAYLESVRGLLHDLPDEDRDEVVQDLEAHLVDLGDADIAASLGEPEEFVAEFRASAGLGDGTRPGRTSALVMRAREHWRTFLGHPIVEQTVTRIEPLKPAWPWARAWLSVSLVAFATTYDGVVFRRFPIPAVSGQTTVGLAALALVTWMSVTATHRSKRSRRLIQRILNTVAAAAILVGLLDPPALVTDWAAYNYQSQETTLGYVGLVSPYGEVSNIFAYDLEGDPVDVLLYDQEGRPLTVSPDVWFINGSQLADTWGPVRFGSDAYGQPITNLFPLERLGEIWDENDGVRYDLLPPPRVALPTLEQTPPTLDPSSIAD